MMERLQQHPLASRQAGFTLSELLIALAILGVIAVFSIPKVLQAQQEAQKKSILKESIATLADITYKGIISNQLQSSTAVTYYMEHLNAIKLCPTNSETEGCWDTAIQGATVSTEEDEPGVVLANGANLVGFNNNGGATPVFGMLIDWNGTEGSNTVGDDQLALIVCMGPSSCAAWMSGTGRKTAGAVGPYGGYGAENTTLYESIFTD